MGNSISVALLESFWLFLGDLHCVLAMPVRTLQEAASVGVFDSVKVVQYHCSIFVQECLGGFRSGVYFVGNDGSDCFV